MDYDGLMEKAEEANRIIPESTPSSVVADFRAKTGELFHDISEMNPEGNRGNCEMPCAGKD